MRSTCGEAARATRRRLHVLGVVAILAGFSPLYAQQQGPPNILLILVDDLGIEHLQFYGVGTTQFAQTDNLDEWQDDWLRFHDAWSSPECSPTRGTIHTGDYPFRTGLGSVVNEDPMFVHPNWGLNTGLQTLLPKMLKDTSLVDAEYETVAFGKWHMGTEDGMGAYEPGPPPAGCTDPTMRTEGDTVPIAAGYDYFHGFLRDKQDTNVDPALAVPYKQYHETTVTGSNLCTELVEAAPGIYATNDVVDWFEEWYTEIRDPAKPWFAYVAFNAPHKPIHCPPTEIYGDVFTCSNLGEQYHAMIQALDIEVGRLLAFLGGDPGPPIHPENTLIIFASDNGSPALLTLPPFDGFSPAHAKCTVFEGGVNVPFLIGGDTVLPGIVDPHQVVGLIDLYATVLTAAGATQAALEPTDSVALQPYFGDPAAGVREFLYTETFFPNFEPSSGLGPSLSQYAARTGQYKMIVVNDFQKKAFYDLGEVGNRYEELGPLQPPTSNWTLEQRAAATSLVDYLTNQLLPPGGVTGICPAGKRNGDACGEDVDCCSGECEDNLFVCVSPAELPCGSDF